LRRSLLLLCVLLFLPVMGSHGQGPEPPPPTPNGMANAPDDAGLREEVDALREQLEDFEKTLEEHHREDGLWIDRLQGLLAAISLGLVLFSLVLALAAVVGWSRMEQFVREKVDRDTHEQRKTIHGLSQDLGREVRDAHNAATEAGDQLRGEVRSLMANLEEEKVAILDEAKAISGQASEELQGRLRGSTALVLGRLARDPDNYLKFIRKDLLDRAIDAAEASYQQLKAANSKHQWNAMNNLVFYRALRGDEFSWQQSIEFAEQLRARVEEGMDKLHFLSTYVRVLGEFAAKTEHPADYLRKAEETLEFLLTDERVNERVRKESRQYTAWLEKKKRSLRGE